MNVQYLIEALTINLIHCKNCEHRQFRLRLFILANYCAGVIERRKGNESAAINPKFSATWTTAEASIIATTQILPATAVSQRLLLLPTDSSLLVVAVVLLLMKLLLLIDRRWLPTLSSLTCYSSSLRVLWYLSCDADVRDYVCQDARDLTYAFSVCLHFTLNLFLDYHHYFVPSQISLNWHFRILYKVVYTVVSFN